MSNLKEKDLPVSEQTGEQGFLYYSKELKQLFDTVEEMKEAEFKYHQEMDEKEKVSKVKREDAKKVEDAYKHLLEVKAKAAKEIGEAEKMFHQEKKNFIEKYRSYHQTYTNVNGEECLSVSDIADALWSAFGRPTLLL